MTTKSKPTTIPNIGTEAITNEDTRIQGEQGQDGYKNHRPDSLEQKREEMMTPTATEGSHPSEEQDESRKLIRETIMPIAEIQNEAKNNAEETKQTK